MGLTRIAIARPVFMLMIMLVVMLMGILSYRGMRVEQNPEVQFGVVSVATVYPGAGPDEVNTLISKPIEEAVSGVAGIREVTSTSQEGLSVVVANFEIGTNMDVALNDARGKVDQVVGQLPTGVEKPTIAKADSSTEPVMSMTLSSKRLSLRELRDLADNTLKDRFAQIPGVASVEVSGGEVRELQVRIKKDALLSYGLGIIPIQRAIQAATLNVPSGRMVTGTQEYAVRVLGEFKTVDDIKNTVLTISDPQNPNAKGKVIRLGDVADVVDGSRERTQFSRINGLETVALTIQKTREGNAVDIATAIMGDANAPEITAEKVAAKVEKSGKGSLNLLEQLQNKYGVTCQVTRTQSSIIKDSIDDLNFSLWFGILLVSLIVYIFLHNFRGMLIVAIAIPVCIFATYIVMKLLGFTINNLSMLALSLAVGVLVDDAIVVLENIYRHLQMGEDPREAALNGRAEIGLAAIAITLADVVVFLPIGTMGGIVGQFFRPLGIGFAVCVLISLFVSFTITPMLAARWYRKGENVEHFDKGFAGWFERRFDAFREFYRRILVWALNHRWFVFVTGNISLVAVAMVIVGGFVPKEAFFFSKGDAGPQPGPGLIMLILSLAVGFIAFGINYWPKKVPDGALRAKAAIGGMAVFAMLLTATAPAKFIQMTLAGAVSFWVIAGVVAFISNFFSPHFKARFMGGAALVGVVFIAAMFLGRGWADFKGEAIFKGGFFPPSDGGQVSVSIELPPGSNLAETTAVVERIEKICQAHPETRYVRSSVGSSGSGAAGFSVASSGSNRASVSVTLKDKFSPMGTGEHRGTRRIADTDVAAQLTEQVGRLAGAKVTVSAAGGVGFGPPIQMSFTGDDRELLVKTVDNIRLKLQNGAIKNVINPDVSSKPGKPEVRAIPDRNRLADVGLTVADLAATMRVLYEGNRDTKFRVSGQEYDVRVMLDYDDRNDPEMVKQIPISFYQGNPVYVPDVANLVQGVGVDKIERRDRAEEVRLTADLLPGAAAGNAQEEIKAYIKDNKLIPEGVIQKDLGQADFQAREGVYLITALLIGFVLVYMLLAALFENMLYPLIIQLAQPQAMVGALLALMITDKTFNIIGFIGLITLVGLVGKNAILLVDYTNTLRAEGMNREEAILKAGPIRLRPISMTTLALILGILPVALALGRGSEFRETIGISIIGGITLSTLLTLLVIPCSYTIFDDLSQVFVNRRKRKQELRALDEEQSRALQAFQDEIPDA
ncbi:MAG: efflux RND transporter permease subunit [Fimbriimonadaceae bacterium]